MSKSFPLEQEIYKAGDGAFFAIPYRAATARMRGEKGDPSSVRLLEFKTRGTQSGYFAGLVEAVREHFGCSAVIAVPGSGVALNSVTLLVDSESPVLLRPRFARPNRHNGKQPITTESEAERIAIDWRCAKKRIAKVLLLDDVARTGTTLDVFANLLIKQGVAKSVVRFSIGRSDCKFTREATLRCVEQPEVEDLIAGTAAAKDDDRSNGLERLRQLRGDIAEMELATRRGELVERDAVQMAFAEVVETVKADLLALPNWGAVELASLGREEIEKRLDRKMRAIALGFERKCGDVRLIAQPKPAKEKANRDLAKKRKARKGK